MFVMVVDRCSKTDADVEVVFFAIMKRSSKSGASGRMIDATLKFKSVPTIENLDTAYLVDFIAMVTDLPKNMIFAAAELDPEAPLKLFLRLTEWHGTMKIPQSCIIKAVFTKVSVERIDSMWEASELKNLKMKLIGAGGAFDFKKFGSYSFEYKEQAVTKITHRYTEHEVLVPANVSITKNTKFYSNYNSYAAYFEQPPYDDLFLTKLFEDDTMDKGQFDPLVLAEYCGGICEKFNKDCKAARDAWEMEEEVSTLGCTQTTVSKFAEVKQKKRKASMVNTINKAREALKTKKSRLAITLVD